MSEEKEEVTLNKRAAKTPSEKEAVPVSHESLREGKQKR